MALAGYATMVMMMMFLYARASAYKGKRGHLTPLEKMDEKLKSENMQKKSIFSTSECTIS